MRLQNQEHLDPERGKRVGREYEQLQRGREFQRKKKRVETTNNEGEKREKKLESVRGR